MPGSESDRLLAQGAAIRDAEGELAVRFSLAAVKRCEDRYGSLVETSTELGWLAQQAHTGFSVPVAERLGVMLECVAGEPIDAWSGPGECIDALISAWLEAFPLPDEGKAEGATTPRSRSRGGSGGGSRSSSAA